MDNNKDPEEIEIIKECTSDTSEDKIVPINEEVTEHIVAVDVPLSVVEEPTCEISEDYLKYYIFNYDFFY